MNDDELAGHLQVLYERLAETEYTTDDRSEVLAFLWLLAEEIGACLGDSGWITTALDHRTDYIRAVRG